MDGIQEALARFVKLLDSNDVAGAQKTLTELKIKMIALNALMPGTHLTEASKAELQIAREVYEQAIRLNMMTQDITAFERHFAHLKPLYFDFPGFLGASQKLPFIIGLNLMRLIAQNRIAEFHLELELLSEPMKQSPYIMYPLVMEQNLMVGAYNKIIQTKSSIPDPAFEVFVNILVETVRDDLAECTEKAYHSISLAYAKQVLMIDDSQALKQYCESRGWILAAGDRVVFRPEEKPRTTLESTVPLLEIMKRTVAYAKELERIV